jgi:hypothetical protein
MKKREITIPTILGLIVALGGLLSGLWLVQRQIQKSIIAAAEETPKEVKISNITDTSFVVSWTTDRAVSGYIQYGESGGEQNLEVTDDRDQERGSVGEYSTHLVTVKGLKPDTAYGFGVGSGAKIYDLDGNPYQVATGPRIDTQPAADVAYGQVITGSGDPADGAIVYLSIPGGVLQATLVKSSGSWVIPLSTIRKADMTGFVSYDKNSSQMNVTVNGGETGKSEVTVFTGDDNPVPEIVLGQNYNFALKNTGSEGASESASMPDETNISKISTNPNLNILAPKPGEKTNSSKPEIIGTAPAGTEVTIEIQSENPISGTAIADNEGKFSFTVPRDLPEGEHTLTVTAVIDGLTKTISRTFMVYAAGESFLPSYTATPSATATPRLTPTPTVKPTSTPIPTPTIKPTATPLASPTPITEPGISPTATPSPSPTIKPTATPKPTLIPTPPVNLPSSGSTDQTWGLLIAGIVMTLSGWWWYRKTV